MIPHRHLNHAAPPLSRLFLVGRIRFVKRCLCFGCFGIFIFSEEDYLEESRATSKDSKSVRSLERYDSIADRAKLIRPGFVHHHGHPISQQTNAGLSRRREKVSTPVRDNSAPEVEVTWTWGEDGECVLSPVSTKCGRLAPPCLDFRSGPLWSR